MKQHFTNFSLFLALLALLAVPLGGFYMFSYHSPSENAPSIPSYVPIYIEMETEVLSSTDERDAESTLEVESPPESI